MCLLHCDGSPPCSCGTTLTLWSRTEPDVKGECKHDAALPRGQVAGSLRLSGREQVPTVVPGHLPAGKCPGRANAQALGDRRLLERHQVFGPWVGRWSASSRCPTPTPISRIRRTGVSSLKLVYLSDTLSQSTATPPWNGRRPLRRRAAGARADRPRARRCWRSSAISPASESGRIRLVGGAHGRGHRVSRGYRSGNRKRRPVRRHKCADEGYSRPCVEAASSTFRARPVAWSRRRLALGGDARGGGSSRSRAARRRIRARAAPGWWRRGRAASG